MYLHVQFCGRYDCLSGAGFFIKIVMLPNCPYCLYFYFKAIKASWDMLLKEGRANAKKVLVVISDRRSASSDSEIENEVKPLRDNDVLVIPVALGNEADEKQLKSLIDDETSLVTAKTTDDTADIKNKLMVVVFKGLLKLSLHSLFFILHSSVFTLHFTVQKRLLENLPKTFGLYSHAHEITL